MANQKLKLDYIESGRISDNDMSEIYGGDIACDTYKVCAKTGKSSCFIYWNCEDVITDYHYCGEKTWIADNAIDELQCNIIP